MDDGGRAVATASAAQQRCMVWRERRASFGELVMWDRSPYAWLEERGPECHLIALIDDATSQLWGRFAEHDSTEENLRGLEGWLGRHGRPLAFYTDRDSLFVINRPARLEEELASQKPLTQIGRALRELGIEWIAARSPQAKRRIENSFGTLQDRLVKETSALSTKSGNRTGSTLSLWSFWMPRPSSTALAASP